MNFTLSSTNKAKTEAAKKVLSKYFPDFTLHSVDVDSGVSKTPDTDDEGIQGCLNRIAAAKVKSPGADGYLGLEGIITKNSFGTFICGWCVVEINGKLGIGCSAKVQLPESIAKSITNFGELSALVKEVYDSELISQMDVIGTNGVITNKAYTRVDEFEDALLCAIGSIDNFH